jgi:hypothetical protein
VRLCPWIGSDTPDPFGPMTRSSNGEANGSLNKPADVAAGCGVTGPRGEAASGLDKCKILGGSGSANGLKPASLSSRIPAKVNCEDTLPFFLRNRFRSLFRLDERLIGGSPARKPCGSLIDRVRPLVLVE